MPCSATMTLDTLKGRRGGGGGVQPDECAHYLKSRYVVLRWHRRVWEPRQELLDEVLLTESGGLGSIMPVKDRENLKVELVAAWEPHGRDCQRHILKRYTHSTTKCYTSPSRCDAMTFRALLPQSSRFISLKFHYCCSAKLRTHEAARSPFQEGRNATTIPIIIGGSGGSEMPSLCVTKLIMPVHPSMGSTHLALEISLLGGVANLRHLRFPAEEARRRCLGISFRCFCRFAHDICSFFRSAVWMHHDCTW